MTKQYSVLREWEILNAINSGVKDDQVKLLKEYGDTPPLNYLFSLNFKESVKLDLPIGTPPYTRDELTNSDFQAALVHHIKKLKNCMVGNTLEKYKRESIFVRMLESVSPKSADILLSCKDRNLQELYPNITKDLIESVLPHLVK